MAILDGATAAVEDVAQALIGEFGSAAAAICGRPSRLRRAGFDPAVIARLGALGDAVRAVTRAAVTERPILSSGGAVRDYLAAHMRFADTESVRALFLDPGRRLISDDLLWTGTSDEAPLYVPQLLHRALDVGANGIILAHNHPAGDPRPSNADLDVTRRVAAAGRALGITLIDHIIVARDATASVRALGFL